MCIFSFLTNTITGECGHTLIIANQTEYQVALITGCLVGNRIIKISIAINDIGSENEVIYS